MTQAYKNYVFWKKKEIGFSFFQVKKKRKKEIFFFFRVEPRKKKNRIEGNCSDEDIFIERFIFWKSRKV